MGMIKKLKLSGAGNSDRRSFYMIEKKQDFFSFFANFLINCGFNGNLYVDEYQEDPPKIEKFIDFQEHFKNKDYDIDVIFGKEKIILIIRANKKNLEHVKSGIENMCDLSSN